MTWRGRIHLWADLDGVATAGQLNGHGATADGDRR